MLVQRLAESARRTATTWTLLSVLLCTSLAHCPAGAATLPRFEGAYFVTPFFTPASSARWGVGDVDGDGRPDVVRLTGSALECYRGRGDGTFEPPVLSEASGELAMTLSDLTGDGRLDVVTQEYFFQGHGDGTFESRQQIIRTGTRNAGPPVVDDFDADGTPDLLVNDVWEILVRPGLGGGALDSLARTGISSQPSWVVAGDLDGDPYPDIVLSNGFSNLEVRRGLGNGQFGPPTFTAMSSGLPHLIDLDHDGRTDLVEGTRAFLGNGDGSFETAGELGFVALAVADLDDDGHADAAGLDLGAVLRAHGDGAGGFGATQSLRTAGHPSALRVVDLEGDGWPEIVAVLGASGHSETSLAVHPNRPGLGFSQLPPRYPAGRAPSDLLAIDANHDGALDLVVANRGERTLALMQGAGNGTFQLVNRIETAAGVRELAVADLEGDGIPEVAVACDSADAVTIVSLLSDGSFGARRDVTVGDMPVALATGDLDGDGRPEIVVSNRLDGTLSVISSSTSGELSVHSVGSPSSYFGPLAVLDGNGDGELDVVTTWDSNNWSLLSSSGAAYFRGDGTGGLVRSFPSPVLVSHRAVDIAGADVDNDGFLDQFVVAGAADSGGFVRGTLDLWLTGPGGSFSSRPWGRGDWIAEATRATSGMPAGLAARDLDGDGLVDALVSDPSGGAVFALQGDAAGFQGPGFGIGVGEEPTGVAVADFDGDGDLDVAVALAGADAVAILSGTAPDMPTAVLVSLIDAHAAGGRVTLRWQASGAPSFMVERAEVPGSWSVVATTWPDGTGIVGFVDADVRPDARYGYRLRANGDASVAASGETWVEVPGTAALALRDVVSNSSRSTIEARFSLGSDAPATLELMDVMGRRIESHEVGSLGAGGHSHVLGAARLLPSGLFIVRLRSEGRSLTAKALMVR